LVETIARTIAKEEIALAAKDAEKKIAEAPAPKSSSAKNKGDK
jgi:hypothetical protein